MQEEYRKSNAFVVSTLHLYVGSKGKYEYDIKKYCILNFLLILDFIVIILQVSSTQNLCMEQ